VKSTRSSPPIAGSLVRDVTPGSLPSNQAVIEESHTDKQSTLLVRTDTPVLDPAWMVEEIGLEDLVLAYMGRADGDDRDDRRAGIRVLQ
jgi:ABC-2 type transport system ATP-binding protein